MPALAYLITFRTYGTWLPGDARGSTDRRATSHGSPQEPPNPSLEQASRRRLVCPPVFLCSPRRAAVEAAIRQHCAHRGWQLLAVHVRTEHVHVVVATGVTPDVAPERVMTELKAWATRRMVQGRLLDEGRRTWSGHGSTLYLFTPESVQRACRYVVERQGKALR